MNRFLTKLAISIIFIVCLVLIAGFMISIVEQIGNPNFWGVFIGVCAFLWASIYLVVWGDEV